MCYTSYVFFHCCQRGFAWIRGFCIYEDGFPLKNFDNETKALLMELALNGIADESHCLRLTLNF